MRDYSIEEAIEIINSCDERLCLTLNTLILEMFKE